MSRVLISHVIDAAERIYGIEQGAITSARRDRATRRSKRAVALVSRVWLRRSLPEIGRRMRRDHATVLYNLRELIRELDAGVIDEIRCLIDVSMGIAGAGRLSPDEWSRLLPWLMRGELPPLDDALKPVAPVADEPEPPPLPKNPPRILFGDDRALQAWFRENNARFIAAMRREHPEMEVELRHR